MSKHGLILFKSISFAFVKMIMCLSYDSYDQFFMVFEYFSHNYWIEIGEMNHIESIITACTSSF